MFRLAVLLISLCFYCAQVSGQEPMFPDDDKYLDEAVQITDDAEERRIQDTLSGEFYADYHRSDHPSVLYYIGKHQCVYVQVKYDNLERNGYPITNPFPCIPQKP